ncbi:hypothetical protein QJQ45_023807 [Haematococcus lacustris]|nr:hypothetical protein QJQ45_023807 [Haematococcus lacustris]
MDLVRVLRAYVLDAVSGGGYKALILDKDTMRVCSTMFGRSELADMNVVHIERLDGPDPKENHPELKAVAFIRPTRDNVTLLKRELKAPRFQSLSLSFTNLVNPIHLQELAEVDAVKEFISEVQELFGDFCVIDSHHFMIPCHRNDILLAPSTAASSTAIIQAEMLDRMVQGLSALFLAVRRRPIIRYQRNSEQASRLADSLYNLTYKQQYQLFDFGARGTPVLLILDRRDDPVTPLLTQWSYQAMIHELIGINDNTVKLTSPKVPEEDREVVLDPRSDDFLLKHAALNFGEVGLSVKALMEHYQTAESKHKQVETLDDMRRFMMEHLDFKRMQGNVIKHVNLMSQLSDTVSKRRLLEVSELEQELANPATGTSASSCAEECARIIRQPDITDFDKASTGHAPAPRP